MPAPANRVAPIPPEVWLDLFVGVDKIPLALVVLLANEGSTVSGLLDEVRIVLVGDEVSIDRAHAEDHSLAWQLCVEPSIATRGLTAGPIGICSFSGIAPHPEGACRDNGQPLVPSAVNKGANLLNERGEPEGHDSFSEATSGHASLERRPGLGNSSKRHTTAALHGEP